MIDIFKDYVLQREELLARIAQKLQLDKTRIEKMESAYNAVTKLLEKDNNFFKGLEIEIYAQGSKRIGTTVKPINGEDFDLDTVLHIYDIFTNYSPKRIYNALVDALKNDTYYKSIMEEKKRCVRLNYKSDFHFDILPACMPNMYDKENIRIPEKSLEKWSSGNPKGFSNWFLDKANVVEETVLSEHYRKYFEAKVESEPLPEELYTKTPLQRAVQLIKRNRDIYFRNKEFPVSSIVITTLVAKYYQGEKSIYETIDNVINQIITNYNDTIIKGHKFKVVNPVNPMEDFTDSWTPNYFVSFYEFISDFHLKWQRLTKSFETSKSDYIKLFGENVYQETLIEQLKYFSKFSKDNIVKSSGAILSGTAFTDKKGKINLKQGQKNVPHHNYGGEYPF